MGKRRYWFCAQNSLNLLACIFEDKKLKLVYRHKEDVEEIKSVDFDYNCDDTYNIKVSVKGSHVICSVDGSTYIDVQTDYALHGGKVAVTATIPAAFGYVKVTVDEATAQRIEKTEQNMN